MNLYHGNLLMCQYNSLINRIKSKEERGDLTPKVEAEFVLLCFPPNGALRFILTIICL